MSRAKKYMKTMLKQRFIMLKFFSLTLKKINPWVFRQIATEFSSKTAYTDTKFIFGWGISSITINGETETVKTAKYVTTEEIPVNQALTLKIVFGVTGWDSSYTFTYDGYSVGQYKK
jgi:hypothetical protein